MSASGSPAADSSTPDQTEGCKCNLKKEHVGIILTISGCIASVFIGVVCVFTILSSPDLITIILNGYVIALSFLSLLVELRVFNLVRALVYHLIKWVYFLTEYSGRGLFYIFLGSLMLDDGSTGTAIVGAATMGIGILNLLAKCFLSQFLYTIVDPEIEKAAKARTEGKEYVPPSLAAHLVASQTGISAETAQVGIDVKQKADAKSKR